MKEKKTGSQVNSIILCITECFMVIIVEQLEEISLGWCGNKQIIHLNAKININRILLSNYCD